MSAIQPVSIYQGRFYYHGSLKVFFGYRLTNGSTVVNTQPVVISMVE